MTETPQHDRVDTDHLRDYSQLRRSVTDRKVAGVAGGLGKHLNIDPTILRVGFVVLALFGGAGLLLYGALWLFVPEEGKEEAVISTSTGTRNAVLLVAAVLAGLLLIGDSWGGFGFPWPLALIALVLFLILMNREKPMNTQDPHQPPWTGGPQQADGETGPPSDAPTAPDRGDTMTLSAEAPPSAPYSGTIPPAAAPYPVQQPPAPQPDRGPKLFWFTLALLAVAIGTLGLYDVAQGGVADAAYAALALTVIGVMLVVGAWFGRPGGLIALGIVASIALLGASVAEPRYSGDRQQVETPTMATQVDERYFVPAGSLHLDLSNIRDVERLDGREIEVEANAGELIVTLPEGIDVNVNADVGVAGEVTVLDQNRGGTGVSIERTVDGGADAPEMDLNVDLLFGTIEVRQ
ncbi:MAG TPA: PspC domain-containing protein [Nocardioidaceae bacterium]|nr:PspC domain-containing protein [Nocardioidaceae bacterium]